MKGTRNSPKKCTDESTELYGISSKYSEPYIKKDTSEGRMNLNYRQELLP